MSKLNKKLFKTVSLLSLLVPVLCFPSMAMAEWGLNFPEPVTTLAKEIFALHMLTTWIITSIMIFIILVVGYACVVHNHAKGYKANQTMHKGTTAKYSWLIVLVIVLTIDSFFGIPASVALTNIETYKPGDVTLKVIGSQWKWTYEYLDDGVKDGLEDNIKFTTLITPEEEAGINYLRETDKHVILPVNKRIRILNTATDVIHAWGIMQFGVKKDAIPGYINETWAYIEKEGIYRGQCMELCGRGHAFMPIVVEAVSWDKYKDWVASTKTAMSQKTVYPPTGNSMDVLMKAGMETFNANCAACHQTNGEGIAGVFPALKGAAIATGSGELPKHITTVLQGRPGTAMPAWGPQLSNFEIASTITYERNAWGNDTGVLIQPAQIESARGSTVAAK